MPQEIVRTVDVIECLDDRLHATQDHVPLDVVTGELYPSILTKIEALVCSPEQKEAISHALTAPSDLNPIVLKDDIPTYYPDSDLGEFKDAVDTIGDLPLTGNNVNDLRPVLTINAIYRWSGLVWLPFIRTGTIDHTQLTLQNGDNNYLHISLSELSSLIAQSHTHGNKVILDAITSLGSGIVISNDERSRIPSVNEKDALAGSIYVPLTPPSASNKYVTSIDPRLNTVKNPYITFGLYGTGATFTALDPSRADITDLEAVFAALATGGTVDYISALEVLPPDIYDTPNIYDFNGGVNWQGITWSDVKPLMMENLASRQVVFQFAPQPAGSIAFWIAAGDGQVIIRGITFRLGSISTLGVLVDRDNTIFEDCTFTATTGVGAKALTITGDNCNLRRCVFNGNLVQGVEITGDNCTVESCRFDFTNASYPALIVSGSACRVASCSVSYGQIQVLATAADTIFDKVRMTANTSFVDAGINTRWLGGIAQDYQQAYIGRTRTVGPINSHADFRGTTHTPFVAALADPYTTEIEVLEGAYTFSAAVTMPEGKTIKTVRKGAVSITGGNCFILNSSSKLKNLNITATGASAITASGISDAEIRDCLLTMNGPDSPLNYAVNASTVSDFKIIGCQFSGTRGIKLAGDSRSRIVHNTFSSNVYSTVTDVTTTDLYYADNGEEGSVCSLAGSRAIIRGNQFLGSLPTKINTTNSLWIGNWPHPTANNTNGLDSIVISTGDLIQPVPSTGAERSSFLGTASIAFTETDTPTSVTLPFLIGARINRLQGYTITLTWTAAVFSGDVKWQVTTVFRECSSSVSDLGTPTTKTLLSTRCPPGSPLTVRHEESCTFTFTSAEYGYGSGIDPTHMSVMIRRLGDDAADTMPGIAYLTEAIITLARD